jgi:hypothetical protein
LTSKLPPVITTFNSLFFFEKKMPGTVGEIVFLLCNRNSCEMLASSECNCFFVLRLPGSVKFPP